VAELREYLAAHLDDGRAWNDAGVLSHRLGDHEAARACLLRALEHVADPEPVVWNLLDLCRAAGWSRPIGEMVNRLSGRGLCHPGRVARWAEISAGRNWDGQAMELVLAGLRRFGRDPGLAALAERIRRGRPRIAFFCGGDGPTFLKPILEYLDRRYPVRYFEGRTVGQVHELMAWSGLSWFEWCTEFAEIGTRALIPCKKIARLHRYEAYGDWPGRVRWDALDALVTVGNSFVMRHLEQQVPDLRRRTRVVRIPNGVDLGRIRFVERTRGTNLAFIADMRLVKNPMLMLQCVRRLVQADSRYRLYWAGRCPDAALWQYVRHMIGALGLEGVVRHEGWQEDIGRWLANKHYIVCTSIIESQGMGVLEGMAAGLKPVVHRFAGAEETFGAEWLFDTPWEFCERVLNGPYEPRRYRQFVTERYDLGVILERVDGLVQELTGQRGVEAAGMVSVGAGVEAPVF